MRVSSLDDLVDLCEKMGGVPELKHYEPSGNEEVSCKFTKPIVLSNLKSCLPYQLRFEKRRDYTYRGFYVEFDVDEIRPIKLEIESRNFEPFEVRKLEHETHTYISGRQAKSPCMEVRGDLRVEEISFLKYESGLMDIRIYTVD